eukprot:gene10081-7051_t
MLTHRSRTLFLGGQISDLTLLCVNEPPQTTVKSEGKPAAATRLFRVSKSSHDLMGTQRFPAATFARLMPRLPRNLVVFDGHCLMCQSRIRYVLERNFSFFHFRSFLLEDPAEAAARLEQHALHFASLDSSEGRELLARFFSKPESRQGPNRGTSNGAKGKAPRSLAPLPEDVAVLFIEKVPTSNWLFLRQQAGRTGRDRGDDELWRNSTLKYGGSPKGKKELAVRHEQLDPRYTDLVVSVNFAAVCRIGMHLDSFLPRLLFRCIYWVVPDRAGAWLFHRYVTERRHTLWGTSEEDAVDILGRVEGMKERRWAWRTHYTPVKTRKR